MAGAILTRRLEDFDGNGVKVVLAPPTAAVRRRLQRRYSSNEVEPDQGPLERDATVGEDLAAGLGFELGDLLGVSPLAIRDSGSRLIARSVRGGLRGHGTAVVPVQVSGAGCRTGSPSVRLRRRRRRLSLGHLALWGGPAVLHLSARKSSTECHAGTFARVVIHVIDDLSEDDPEEGLEALQQLLEARFFLGLAAQLSKQYRKLRYDDVEDAIATALENVVKRLETGPVRDIRKYLSRAAYNECNKLARLVPEDALPDRHGSQRSVEDTALRDVVIDLIKAEVRRWENAHIREVVLVYIEMILANEILEIDEVAAIVSQNLGEEINPLSVSQWKARGMRRLAEFAESNHLYERRHGGEEEQT